MGWFSKKSDPITERAKQLNDQISALEAEIQRLASQTEKEKEKEPNQPIHEQPGRAAKEERFQRNPASTSPFHRASAPTGAQPRLRSTALPHGQLPPTAGAAAAHPAPPTPPAHDPIFEEVGQERIQSSEAEAVPLPEQELGVRKDDFGSLWNRVKNQFRGPVTSNPKLVHYLSAGSIQGLRPLRYEKRVARNRVIVLAAFLVLALWGLIAIFISRR